MHSIHTCTRLSKQGWGSPTAALRASCSRPAESAVQVSDAAGVDMLLELFEGLAGLPGSRQLMDACTTIVHELIAASNLEQQELRVHGHCDWRMHHHC